MTLKEKLRQLQEPIVRKALIECGNNISMTADYLDVSRNKLYAMIDRYGIAVGEFEKKTPMGYLSLHELIEEEMRKFLIDSFVANGRSYWRTGRALGTSCLTIKSNFIRFNVVI